MTMKATQVFRQFAGLLIALFLFGCSRPEIESPEEPDRAWITFIHAARPSGGYTFYLNGEKIAFLANLAYSDAFRAIAPGKSILEVRNYNNELVSSQMIDLKRNEHYTITVIGDRTSGKPEQAVRVLVSNEDYSTPYGKAKVSVLHAADGESLDLIANDQTAFEDLAYSNNTGFVELHTNVNNSLRIKSGTGDKILFSFQFPFVSGKAYVVIVSQIAAGPGTTSRMNILEFQAPPVN